MKERLTKIMRDMSEWREKVNELAIVAEPTEAQTAELVELRSKLTAGETEYRNALDAEGDTETGEVTAEERERRQLVGKVRVGRFFEHAISGRPIDGAEAEVGPAFTAAAGDIPLELFEDREHGQGAVEHRAVTPVPGTTDQTMNTITPAIFARSVAAYLGIDMPSVGVGVQAYPALGTNVTASALEKSGEAPATAGAYTVRSVSPVRVSGAVEFQREDAAVFSELETSLRTNLSDVMTDAVNDLSLNGKSASPDVDGLIDGLGSIPNAATGVETFARYLAASYAQVDGTLVETVGGVRQLVNPATYAHMGSLIAATDSPVTAEAFLRQVTGGVRANSKVPAAASNIATAVFRRETPGRVAVWSGISLVRDEVTQARKGIITVTAYMLIGKVSILRSAAFVGKKYRLA